MRIRNLILLLVLASVLGHRSDGQQAKPIAEQLRLAGVMPRGALVYVQAADLSALMKLWLASPVRSKFYDSPSFIAFQKSHVYQKFQDRKKDFEEAIGVGIDEKRLAELSGRASAVSIYDIGKLELVFVTEVTRPRAIVSTLFKQVSQFQERSADGASYYVKDVATDGGRLNQQFCFAYIEGKLIVTTTEGLMIRAIANAKSAGDDSLSAEVVPLAEAAEGFAAHEITMWLDQARLNRNRYFNNYWIHHNSDALAKIEGGLIDLRFTREGMIEQRWFKMGVGGRGLAPGTMSADQFAALMNRVPANAQLVQIHAAAETERLSSAIERSLFGKLPEESWSPPEPPDKTRNTNNEGDKTRAERYSRLDARFDIDVDDDQAPKRGTGTEIESSVRAATGPAGMNFAKSMGSILSGVSSGTFSELVRSKNEAGKPFVSFERAVVVQLTTGAAVNREEMEHAIIDELRARFVVAGTAAPLEWQEEGGIRFVGQSLLSQGAAYTISEGFLAVASSRELAGEIVQAAKASKASSAALDGTGEYFALIRIAAAKPVFDTLMSKLDGRDTKSVRKRDKDEEQDRDVKFFSENVSSLIAATEIREARLTRRSGGGMMTERATYSW